MVLVCVRYTRVVASVCLSVYRPEWYGVATVLSADTERRKAHCQQLYTPLLSPPPATAFGAECMCEYLSAKVSSYTLVCIFSWYQPVSVNI